MSNFKIIICIIILLGIYLFGRTISFKGITAPQTLNAVSFIPSLFLLLFYVESWDVDLSILTITLIIAQPLIFTVISIGIKAIFSKKSKRDNNTLVFAVGTIRTPNIIILTFFNIISLILLIGYEISYLGSFTNFSTLLFQFRHASSTGEAIDLPGLVSLFRLFSVYSGFIWIYLLIINVLEKRKKHSKLYLLNLLLSFLTCIAMGARGTALMLIASGVIQFLFLYYRKINYSNDSIASRKIREKKFKKNIYILALICILAATQFDKLANLMGRDTSDFTGLYYLALYLSAPIKNLDTFLREGCMGFAPSFGNSKTLALLIAYLGPKYFGFTPHNAAFGYKYVNGLFMGNVYTAYANFYYDYGIISFLFFSIIMAILTNYTYSKSLYSYNHYTNDICVPLIIYSIMAFGLIFNFFANEYYNTIFNIGFFRGIIILLFVRWFLLKVRFTFGK